MYLTDHQDYAESINLFSKNLQDKFKFQNFAKNIIK